MSQRDELVLIFFLLSQAISRHKGGEFHLRITTQVVVIKRQMRVMQNENLGALKVDYCAKLIFCESYSELVPKLSKIFMQKMLS